MLLAVDTSTAIASLALLREGQVLGELTWRAGFDHSRELLPNLIGLLRQCAGDEAKELATHDLWSRVDALAVAIGPGSYNGLRVALSTVKGLALARNLPVVGVSTLEVQAYQFAYSALPIWSLLPAGKEHLAAGLYRMDRRRWSTLREPHLLTPEELYAQIKAPSLLCGEISPHLAAELEERLGEQAVIAAPPAALRRAAFLGVLGQQRLERGERDDLAQLQPLYLRRPQITPRKES